MIYTPLINRAMILAYNAHNGQKDKSGLPYIFHVAHIAEQMQTEDTIVIALLHDTLEDTQITEEHLKLIGCSEKIIDAVKAITRKKNEPYFDYIKRCKKNELACTVKIADLMHNSNLDRLPYVDEKDKKRVCKYTDALNILLQKEISK